MGNVKVVLQFGKSTKFLEPNGWIDGVINDGTLGDLKSMVPYIQKDGCQSWTASLEA